MKLILIKTKEDNDFQQFILCNNINEPISSFDVEINRNTALISYKTSEQYQNKGYASEGLIKLKEELFKDDNILFLELINLSGDYSRKVAENAGFISPSNNLDYYVLLNPRAEEILTNLLNTLDDSSLEYKKAKKLLEKVKVMKNRELMARSKQQEKLNELLERLELESDEEYRKKLEEEIKHLKKVLNLKELNKTK